MDTKGKRILHSICGFIVGFIAGGIMGFDFFDGKIAIMLTGLGVGLVFAIISFFSTDSFWSDLVDSMNDPY